MRLVLPGLLFRGSEVWGGGLSLGFRFRGLGFSLYKAKAQGFRVQMFIGPKFEA